MVAGSHISVRLVLLQGTSVRHACLAASLELARDDTGFLILSPDLAGFGTLNPNPWFRTVLLRVRFEGNMPRGGVRRGHGAVRQVLAGLVAGCCQGSHHTTPARGRGAGHGRAVAHSGARRARPVTSESSVDREGPIRSTPCERGGRQGGIGVVGVGFTALLRPSLWYCGGDGVRGRGELAHMRAGGGHGHRRYFAVQTTYPSDSTQKKPEELLPLLTASRRGVATFS